MMRSVALTAALALVAPPIVPHAPGQVLRHRPARPPFRHAEGRTHRGRRHRERSRYSYHLGLSPVLLAEWTRVAVCEEGGWIGYAGPAYPDSLGINAANWYANGGGSDLSPAAQIAVAQRIEGGGYVPDQSGCAAW